MSMSNQRENAPWVGCFQAQPPTPYQPALPWPSPHPSPVIWGSQVQLVFDSTSDLWRGESCLR